MKTVKQLLAGYGDIPLAEKVERLRRDWAEAQGLGDAVKAVTAAAGIKPCGGCQKRAQALNRAVPFRRATQRGHA